jgi:uncharacterized integral membrane protein
MQIFPWLSLGIILCAAIFAIQNSTAPPLAMKFLLWNFETSLIYAVLGSVGIGMLIILFLWIPRAILASFRARKLKKEVEFLHGEMKNHPEESKKSPEERRCPGFSQQTPAFLGGPEKVRR